MSLNLVVQLGWNRSSYHRDYEPCRWRCAFFKKTEYGAAHIHFNLGSADQPRNLGVTCFEAGTSNLIQSLQLRLHIHFISTSNWNCCPKYSIVSLSESCLSTTPWSMDIQNSLASSKFPNWRTSWGNHRKTGDVEAIFDYHFFLNNK